MLRRDMRAGQNGVCDLGRIASVTVSTMRLSTRNQLTGTIAEINLGSVMATVKVTLDPGGQTVVSSITKEAVEELGLTVGQPATVLVKSTEVTIGVE